MYREPKFTITDTVGCSGSFTGTSEEVAGWLRSNYLDMGESDEHNDVVLEAALTMDHQHNLDDYADYLGVILERAE